LLEATRLDPKSPWAFYNLGILFRQSGDKRQAATQLKRALAVQPDFRPAQEALAKLQITP
jgi:Tfp pilus assembly protein PilF